MNKRILLISFSLLSTFSAVAQGGPPPPDGGGGPGTVTDVPIDNHLWILVILAVVLGVLFVKLQSLRSKV
ncbi:hypothetical protein [Psychroflexus tropicus]|uniref:hypothetical protein n=1 Tax=Psychroflexus tropicus TaxID=197345 RepID=UPI0012FC30E2|nr:hypothetical protein [Psychroflexus tropicus]